MSKKIISLAVAVLMVVAMLPLNIVSANNSGETAVSISYEFNTSCGLAVGTRIDTITSYEQTGDTWRYLSASPNAKASQLKDYFLNGDTRAVDHYIAVEINVPADGTYKPEFLYQTIAGRGGVGDIYILPEGGLTNLAEAKANGTKIASVDYSSDATKEKNEAEMLVDSVELKGGTNVLLFVVTGKGAKATTGDVLDYFMYPYKLTLKPTEKNDEEEEGETQSAKRNYIFDNLSIGVAENTVISTITSYDQTGGLWRYLAGSPNAKNSQLKNYFLNGDTRAVDHYIAVEINVPADGTYKPEFFYQTIAGRGGTGDIYILPEGGLTNLAEAKANGTKIASVDYSSDVTEGNVEAKMSVSEIELKKGTNVLLFVVTGKGAKATTGDALDYFTYPYMLKITGTKITEDAELTDAFAVKKEDLTGYVAPSVVSVTVDGKVIAAEKNADNSYNVEAPEENTAGEAFLYWAKGLSKDRRIISFSNKLTSYIPDENGASILIAVYDGNGPETAEYYNANGQLIAKGEEPAKPSMAGYGTATAWKQYGNKNIFVAEYAVEEPAKDIEVTVINGEGTDTYAYGDTVTCIADTAKDNFKCWTKSDINGNTEIVSVDRTYSFKAWEKCTVTAIYEDYNYNGATAKIVLDTFTAGKETAIMAEFIGFTDVIEKGIMCGTNKIAMTKPGNQFTVIADEATTYVGYAILKSGDAFYMITDGEVKVQ